MTIDHNVCAAARMMDQERPVGPLEDELLTALESHDVEYAKWSASRKALEALFGRVLSAWLSPGTVIDTHAENPPRCLPSVRVASGAPRGATKFRIATEPSVEVADSGDPELSTWSCRAIPISPKTGKDMNGRPSNSAVHHDGVTLKGGMFWAPYSKLRGAAAMQEARDAFAEMVGEAERVLAERSKP